MNTKKLKTFFKKGLPYLLIAALLTGLVFRYGRGSLTLRLGIFAGSSWQVPDPESADIIDQAIARFEEAHPGVHMEYESGIRPADYSEWLASRLLEGELPDVFMVLDNDFPSLAGMGALKNLNGYLYAKDLDADAFYAPALQSGMYNGNLYGIPYMSNPQFMFVNLSLLEKEGITPPENGWSLHDLYSICEKVSKDLDGDGRIDQFGIYRYTWQNAMQAADESVFNDNGSDARFTEPAVQEAISFAFRLQDLNEGAFVSQSDFDQGRVAFAPMSYAEYKTYKPYPWKVKKFSAFDWTIVPMPKAGMGCKGAVVDTLLLSLSSNTPYAREAWDLASTLACDEAIQQALLEKSSGLPSTRLDLDALEKSAALSSGANDGQEEAENQEPAASLDYEIIDHVMNNSRTIRRFAGYQDVFSLADSRIESAYQSAEDKDIFFIDLQQFMQNALRKAGS